MSESQERHHRQQQQQRQHGHNANDQVDNQQFRWGSQKDPKVAQFIELYRGRLGHEPDYVICSPGRVNLIGDHIDYHGFSVLPMAIERCIWLGCRVVNKDEDSSRLEIHNSSDSYPTWTTQHSLLLGDQLSKSHQWYNYVLCGYHGVLACRLLGADPAQVLHQARNMATSELAQEEARQALSRQRLPTLEILVHGDLPSAAGLSSSSALVCASALASSLLLEHSRVVEQGDTALENLSRASLAASCAKFEHLIGTHGGGMDQAVIMTAQKGYAKHVQFFPELSCDNVSLPANTIWLVSHCGVSYPKAATSGFNTRVLETKLGAAMIVKAADVQDIPLDSSITLGKVKDRLFAGLPAEKIVLFIREKVFSGQNEFTVEEVCAKLDISRDELVARFNTNDQLLRDNLGDRLKILVRCEHVFEEAERVERFKSISDTTTDIVMLGQLMTQSHYSLRDKYECSHSALDRLVSVALDAGALGSRLTGAGWGGCIVSLVEKSKCDVVTERLKEVSGFTFRTEPQNGCQIFRIRAD